MAPLCSLSASCNFYRKFKDAPRDAVIGYLDEYCRDEAGRRQCRRLAAQREHGVNFAFFVAPDGRILTGDPAFSTPPPRLL